ncbi:CDGSH iron-sulfur domain-containing protein [Candidatus Peregrinibacteria bacterium]|nr:CDGSH iron-sulfur domain-containing protein [Candidatus Peregrinibacteria bacterium]
MGKPVQKGKIEITRNGPYVVTGNVPLGKEVIDCQKEKDPVKWTEGEKYKEQKSVRLCRCGHSGNKPYCDGSHLRVGFDGAETASREPYAKQCETYVGPGVDMTDAQDLCSSARFCHRGGGSWKLVEESDDPKAKELLIRECAECPSGRLVAMDKKTGKPIEPLLEPSIGIVEDPQRKSSGPLWVKGGIPIVSADGFEYEVRNRVTLCRCGQSGNKPFCDGSHSAAKFNDGDKSIQ